MALFSRSKKTTDEKALVVASVSKARPTDRNLAGVILAPVVTEKAILQQGRQVYAFYVHKNATKHLVADAIAAFYKVTPVSVNIVNKATRTTMARARGREVKVSGYKKAYVYLKAGDSISIA